VSRRSTAIVHHWNNKKNDPKKTINQLVYMAEILGLKDLGVWLVTTSEGGSSKWVL